MEESTLVIGKEKEVAALGSAARLIREVRRYTRRKFSAENKIRIVLEGFRKEIPVSDLCRRESISSAIYTPTAQSLPARERGLNVFSGRSYFWR